jgi:hypothetical protein
MSTGTIHSKGVKRARFFVDEDAGEEEYCDERADTAFVDDGGGVAHYHIVYDDGDEEEVYNNEAIRLPRAANGLG